MGEADYFRLGDWNARCARCGKKRKGSDLIRQWQGYWVCPEHWEPRQPQDYVRAIQENPTPPFVQNPEDTFVQFCSPAGISGIAGYGTAGCMIAGYTHPALQQYLDESNPTGGTPP